MMQDAYNVKLYIHYLRISKIKII
jgi:hypothetical protein